MNLRTSTLDIETADGTCDAYLAAPEGEGHYPGVVVYMDIFGPRPRLELMAQRIAGEGYVVLLPHVFYRRGRAPLVDTSGLMDPDARPKIAETVMAFTADLTPERVTSDADAFVDYLLAHDEVSSRIGTVGYCFGAGLAFRAAAHRPDAVRAMAGFHPARLATEDETSPHLLSDRLDAEVYVAAADQDQSMPPEAQQRLDQALTEAGVRHVVEQYDGAPHGFTMSDTAAFHEAATERHWSALFDLFDRALR